MCRRNLDTCAGEPKLLDLETGNLDETKTERSVQPDSSGGISPHIYLYLVIKAECNGSAR
jgi:hypothetical protein